jgi:hypothetical protein
MLTQLLQITATTQLIHSTINTSNMSEWIHQPTNPLNRIQYNTNHKIQFKTGIKLLHVSTRVPSSGSLLESAACHEFYFMICTLLCAFVGWCTKCKNMHGISNIKCQSEILRNKINAFWR